MGDDCAAPSHARAQIVLQRKVNHPDGAANNLQIPQGSESARAAEQELISSVREDCCWRKDFCEDQVWSRAAGLAATSETLRRRLIRDSSGPLPGRIVDNKQLGVVLSSCPALGMVLISGEIADWRSVVG